MKRILLLCTLFTASLLFGTDIEIDPSTAVIVAPPSEKVAAAELQKHLRLITGVQIPIRAKADHEFAFTLGNPPAETKLSPEETRWEVTPDGVRLYGEGPNGTSFAVYDFLEKQFKIRWIEPGDRGICYPEMKKLKLTTGSGKWTPGQLGMRQIRHSLFPFNGYSHDMLGQGIVANQGYNHNLPDPMKLSLKEYNVKNADIEEWHRRMRMGRHLQLSYGHAFQNWWELYGKTHPEYFALVKGKRAPVNPAMPDTIKLCVSNPAVHRQIVDNWRKNNGGCINLCPNDWGNYCECENCRKLDMPPAPGQKWDTDLSDRYIYFTNKVLELASQYDPDVKAAIYAYSNYVNAPRREKVHPNLIIGFVPSMLELDKVEQQYRAWSKAGARKLFLRPNDHGVDTGLPMGFEKQIYEGFRLGEKYGIIGTDYDGSCSFWPANGIADYILARAHANPESTFEELEDEYCSGFGAAKMEAREYYRYWRENVWEKRIYPDRKRIAELGLYGNFRRGLMWNLGDYFKISDFDATDAILERAAAKAGPQDKERIEMLRLANRCFRLDFEAITAKGDLKTAKAKELLEFRCANHRKLFIDWNRLATLEGRFGDIAGIASAWKFRDCDAVVNLPEKWFFIPDPQNVGPQEKWENCAGDKIRARWEPILTTAGWERQEHSGMHPKMRKQLENYDGYGYYGLELKISQEWKGRKISVLFGAVDESAWVYLNGRKVGERIYREGSNDWKESFEIQIDSAIDWNLPTQTLVVRVHDSGGQGGIWRPCILLCR